MTRRKLSLLLLLAASLAAPLWAGTHSAAAFKKLQSLSGDWEGKDEHGMPVKTAFKVLASGTAVMETLSPSGMEEMVTLYSMDGDGIALVHYCPTNNQPRMRVVPASDDVKELSFDFEGAGNLKSPSTGHQHHLVLRFDDPPCCSTSHARKSEPAAFRNFPETKAGPASLLPPEACSRGQEACLIYLPMVSGHRTSENHSSRLRQKATSGFLCPRCRWASESRQQCRGGHGRDRRCALLCRGTRG